ncbi:unnamed protein product [Staurois parvus]|uniref:Uncharacterized protein n=1 Tax=Staurois parvus TaxID=386267 RepID=A0ABN9HGA2_9NEOB|nr:unnamed protein product [Staurois parvus]
MSSNIHLEDISHTQSTNTPRVRSLMSGKMGLFLKNISHTQDRNTASPPCEISDVCKDWTSVKNISHTQDRNVASPLCEISDVYERLDFTEKNFPHSGQECGFSPV